MLPLDNIHSRRAELTEAEPHGGTEGVFTYSGGLSSIPNSGAPHILNRSYTITADVEIPADGAHGMIVTDGGRFGGYGLFLSKGVMGVRPGQAGVSL